MNLLWGFVVVVIAEILLGFLMSLRIRTFRWSHRLTHPSKVHLVVSEP